MNITYTNIVFTIWSMSLDYEIMYANASWSELG